MLLQKDDNFVEQIRVHTIVTVARFSIEMETMVDRVHKYRNLTRNKNDDK